MKRHLLKWGTAAVMLTMLTACGGGGGSTGSVSTSVSGVASKGPIKDGEVTVYAVDAITGQKGKILGTDMTDDQGNYSVDLKGYTGNVLVEVVNGTYIDEANPTGPRKDNVKLQAALPEVTGQVTVAVTPLTELAVKMAGTNLTKTEIQKANALVGIMAGGIDIIGTKPANAAASAGTTIDDTKYGLMLAAISVMSQGSSVDNVLAALETDFADGALDTKAAELKTALQNFIADPSLNKTDVKTLADTNLESAIDLISDPNALVVPASPTSDVQKAKDLIADFRNTMLSIVNYKGIGTDEGMVEAPFNKLSTELTTEVEPLLASSMDRLGWIIQASAQFLDGIDYLHTDASGNTLALTQSGSTVSFTVKDPSNNTLDSGSLTINNLDTPTSGSLTATLYTPSGDMTVNATYAGAFTNGLISSVTLTGLIQAPGLTVDFSQSGRKLSVTLAEEPNNPTGFANIYPTSVSLSARITTNSARFDGALSGTFGWAANASNSYDYWTSQWTCTGGFVPKTAAFTGSFAELNSGVENGLKFSGTINASFPNATTYNGCAETTTTNFKQWSAQFNGKIEAPNRPVIEATLKGSESTRGVVLGEASYTRTNTDGSAVFLTGSWDSNDNTNLVNYSFTNQDGLKLKINVDENLSTCSERLSGTIETSGGTGLADLSDNCMPKIKYTDGYIETII